MFSETRSSFINLGLCVFFQVLIMRFRRSEKKGVRRRVLLGDDLQRQSAQRGNENPLPQHVQLGAADPGEPYRHPAASRPRVPGVKGGRAGHGDQLGGGAVAGGGAAARHRAADQGPPRLRDPGRERR